jgi:RNA polymerase-interacting CarD/CdnL/TRCF family regulator
MNSKQTNWELVNQLTYEALDKGDILELLRLVKDIHEVTPEETPYRELVYNIAKEVATNRKISYKQWRSLNAFVTTHTRQETNYKHF